MKYDKIVAMNQEKSRKKVDVLKRNEEDKGVCRTRIHSCGGT